jgi:exodeoxyribonuclease VII large subunit
LLRRGTLSIERLGTRLRLAERALQSVGPLATLTRGYAIVTDTATGRVLMDATDVVPGTHVHARLARGGLDASVTRIDGDDDAER